MTSGVAHTFLCSPSPLEKGGGACFNLPTRDESALREAGGLGSGCAGAMAARDWGGRAMRARRGLLGALTGPRLAPHVEQVGGGERPQRGGLTAPPPRGIEPRPLCGTCCLQGGPAGG